MNRLADGADRLREVFDRMMPRDITGIEMHLGGPVIVARNEAEQDFREEAPLLRTQTPHNSEIDRNQPCFVIDEQIAGMHVGVKETVAQRVPQKTLDHIAAERCQIKALRFKRAVVTQADAIDPFQGEHFAGGAIPVDGGHAEVGVLAGILRHFRSRGGFQPEIHFDCDRAGERRHHLDQPEPARFRGESLRLACRKEESVQIGLEPALDARAKNLDRDRLARAVYVDLRAMHLRNRCCSHRRTKACIDRRKRFAERGYDSCLRLALRERRHLVLKAFQIARDRRTDHVRPCRQELAELDVGRPSLLSAAASRLSPLFVLGRSRRRATAMPALAGKGRGRVSTRANTPSRANTKPARVESEQMGRGSDHKRQPECNATTPPVMGVNDARRNPAASIIWAKAFGFGNFRIDSTRY